MTKVVVVKWGDAFIDPNDFDEKSAAKTKPVLRSTVGFLVAKNQHGYVLATDKYARKKDGYSARMFIPHGMVTDIIYMETQTCTEQKSKCLSRTS